MTSIPITLGINIFLTQLGVRPYLGVGGGLISQKEEGITDFKWGSIITEIEVKLRRTDPFVFVTAGVSMPINDKISLETNVKYNFGAGNIRRYDLVTLNIGVAYLLP